ncbi:slipin family protein, partial [Streptomyces sp. NPDC006632]
SLAAAALGDASDTMMAHPLALQLRNLQSLVEIGVDKNTTVVFPAPLMSTIGELGAFLSREAAAAGAPPTPHPVELAKTVHAAGSNNKPGPVPHQA